MTTDVYRKMQAGDIIEGVEISHDRYLRSHGKKARDTGSSSTWMFTHKNSGDVDHNDSTQVHTAQGSFSDAKKSAASWAKKHGHRTAYVMEEVESIDELSKATAARYVKSASVSAAGIASGVGRDVGAGKKAHPDDKRQLNNRLKGINRATDKLTKEHTMEETWTVYKRINEKNSRSDHYKGATPPQPHGDNLSQKDKQFMKMHNADGPFKADSHVNDDVTDSGPHHTTNNVKVAPKRPGDSTIGDKKPVKQAK